MANTLDPMKQEARAATLQEVLYEKWVGKLIANTKFENLFTGNDTVHFPRLAPIVSQDLTTSYTDVTVQDLTTTDETFVLDTRKHFAFSISDEDMIEMKVDPQSQAIQDGAEAFAGDYDTAIMAEYANAAYTVDDGNMEVATNGWAGNPIILTNDNVYDMLTAVSETMNVNNMPMSDRFVVISPKEERFLRKSDFFVQATSKGDEVVANGIIGRALGMNIVLSNNVNVLGLNRNLIAWAGKPVCFAANIRPNVQFTPSQYRNSFTNLVKAQTKFGVKTFTEGANRMIHIPVVA